MLSNRSKLLLGLRKVHGASISCNFTNNPEFVLLIDEEEGVVDNTTNVDIQLEDFLRTV